MKLLYYSNTNDPLSQSSVPDPVNNVYNQLLFPRPYNPSVLTTEVSLLNLYFDRFTPENLQFKDFYLIFDVICHENLWQLGGDKKGLRPFYMMHELDSMFNLQHKIIGIGKMLFADAGFRFYGGSDTKFSGYQLRYKITDFA